ncbi:MAG: hypothetical protein ACYC5N_04875, partial [Endomicrobiales bacterium]
MAKRSALILIVSILLATGVTPGRAQLFTTLPPTGKPSVFEYGWRGLLFGSLAGAAGGYLRYADESDSDNLLRSIGYGSLAGAGVGLLLGFYDAAAERRGMGDIILHDMYLGAGFGTAVGAIVGGINALANSDWKSLGTGASWGYLGGVVLGLGVALYEGPRLLGE